MNQRTATDYVKMNDYLKINIIHCYIVSTGIFGYVTVFNQKRNLESRLCVLVNIALLLYIEMSKITIQREPSIVQLDSWNTSVFYIVN